MSGADTLRQAADLIDTWADGLPEGGWEYTAEFGGSQCGIYSRGYLQELGHVGGFGEKPEEVEQVAVWITTWSPGLGRLIAEFLRDLAEDAEEVPVDMRAVALAEVIVVALGGALPKGE